MSKLVEFLRARLDEDERAAKAWLPFGNPDAEARAHIARHDPARVLAEVDAKRRILDLVTDCGPEWGDGYTEAYRDVVRLLARPYASHPDYREEWRR